MRTVSFIVSQADGSDAPRTPDERGDVHRDVAQRLAPQATHTQDLATHLDVFVKMGQLVCRKLCFSNVIIETGMFFIAYLIHYIVAFHCTT